MLSHFIGRGGGGGEAARPPIGTCSDELSSSSPSSPSSFFSSVSVTRTSEKPTVICEVTRAVRVIDEEMAAMCKDCMKTFHDASANIPFPMSGLPNKPTNSVTQEICAIKKARLMVEFIS